MTAEFKQKVYKQLLVSLNEKIDAFQFALDELSISVLNETKSTAGDKHETALAMLQTEQSQIAEHLYEVIDHRTFFLQVNPEEVSETVRVGSLVRTSKGCFFISVALPKIVVDQIAVIAISPKSPLGEKLLGCKVGDKIEINSIQHVVEEIV